MIKSLKGKKKGFSLVELIVVIAIIGILAAIAVPKYSAYQDNAKKKANVATAKLFADATIAYAESVGKTPDELDGKDAGNAVDEDEMDEIKKYVSTNITGSTVVIEVTDSSVTAKVTTGTITGESTVNY